MSVIEVGGPQSVGKSSTIEKARALSRKEVPLIKRSVVLARILGVSVDEVVLQPPDQLEAAREIMHKEVAALSNGVRDSHFCIFEDKGHRFPFRESDVGVVSLVVLMTASIESIRNRRLTERRHRSTDLAVIERQLELETTGAELLAQRLESPLIVIHNESQQQAASELAELFDHYIE